MRSTVILLGLIVIASVSAKPPRGVKEGEVPFFTGTEAWSDIFETVKSRHEKSSNQIVFTLKAKKAARVGNYYAFLGDGDNVELGKHTVKFNPPVTSVTAGTQVQAVVSLGSISAKDVGNLTVRQKR